MHGYGTEAKIKMRILGKKSCARVIRKSVCANIKYKAPKLYDSTKQFMFVVSVVVAFD